MHRWHIIIYYGGLCKWKPGLFKKKYLNEVNETGLDDKEG